MINPSITQLTPELLAAKQSAENAWDVHLQLVERIFTDEHFDPAERAREIVAAAETARRLEAEYRRLYEQQFGTDKE